MKRDKDKLTDVGKGFSVNLNWSLISLLFISWGAVLLGLLLFKLSALRLMLPLIMVVLIGYLVYGTVIAIIRQSPVVNEEISDDEAEDDWEEQKEPAVTKIPEE